MRSEVDDVGLGLGLGLRRVRFGGGSAGFEGVDVGERGGVLVCMRRRLRWVPRTEILRRVRVGRVGLVVVSGHVQVRRVDERREAGRDAFLRRSAARGEDGGEGVRKSVSCCWWESWCGMSVRRGGRDGTDAGEGLDMLEGLSVLVDGPGTAEWCVGVLGSTEAARAQGEEATAGRRPRGGPAVQCLWKEKTSERGTYLGGCLSVSRIPPQVDRRNIEGQPRRADEHNVQVASV